MTRRSDPNFDPIADWHRRNRRPTLLEELWGLTRIGFFVVGTGLLVIGVVLILHLIRAAETPLDYVVPLSMIPAALALLWLCTRRTFGVRYVGWISRILTVLAAVCALYDVGPLAMMKGVGFPRLTVEDPAGSGAFFVASDRWLDQWEVVSYRSPLLLGCSRELAVISDDHDLHHITLLPTQAALTISAEYGDGTRELTIPRGDLLELFLLGPRRWSHGEQSSRFSWTPFEAFDSLLMLVVAAILRRAVRTSRS